MIYFIVGYIIHEVYFNNTLIDYQRDSSLSQKWGGGINNSLPHPPFRSSLNHIVVMFGDFREAYMMMRDVSLADVD